MRRRRQKNTLLPKMIGLAVLINAILLPILAQFGVFKSIGGRQRLTEVELVKAPPPEKRPEPPKKTPKKQAARPKPSGHKAPSRAVASRHVPSGPPVKVVAAAGPAGANGSGGDAGITTSDSGPVTPTPTPSTNPTSTPIPAAVTPAPPPVTNPTPAPPPVETKPLPPPPHIPVLTAATPLEQPHPSIPDDLRDSDISTKFEGLFTVHPDGTATVKMVSSTGSSALDALALDAAHHWTFHPAMRDGQPVESYLRLKIEFAVTS